MLETQIPKMPVLIHSFRKEVNEKLTKTRLFGLYKCQCGKEFECMVKSINSAKTLSCGCHQKKQASISSTTHGKSMTTLYKKYSGMKSRCYSKSDYHYKWYGDRGIVICDEWIESFENFYNWAMDNGYEKNLEIDRINNDGNYEPSNCRFVDKIVNIENTREIITTNTSGFRNIAMYKNKYRVIIKGKHIGMYCTLDEAIIARNHNHTRIFK